MGSVVGHLGETCSVYYCIDEYSAFPNVDPDSVRRMEKDLLESVDLCFCSAKNLVDDKKRVNPNTHLSRHGVAFDHFAHVQDDEFPVAEDIADIPHPVIGFFGYIERKWLDFDLIREMAAKKPDWQIVLVGKSIMDLSMLERTANIHIVGQRHFNVMPRYGKAFDVCTIPFLVNDMTLHANPIKLWEYLAMGKPVVSTDLPEVGTVEQEGVVEIGTDHDDFIAKVEACLGKTGPEYVAKRQALAKERGTWEARMEAIGARIREVEEGKGVRL
jgi:glycosyltransferase involved in cell wall biosynthesis